MFEGLGQWQNSSSVLLSRALRTHMFADVDLGSVAAWVSAIVALVSLSANVVLGIILTRRTKKEKQLEKNEFARKEIDDSLKEVKLIFDKSRMFDPAQIPADEQWLFAFQTLEDLRGKLALASLGLKYTKVPVPGSLLQSITDTFSKANHLYRFRDGYSQTFGDKIPKVSAIQTKWKDYAHAVSDLTALRGLMPSCDAEIDQFLKTPP
jgi:hypothetical protein